MPHEQQVILPVTYKGLTIEKGYRIDVLFPAKLIVEVKAVDAFAPIHDAQLLTYLRLTGIHVGLLLNFHAPVLRNGIRRLVL